MNRLVLFTTIALAGLMIPSPALGANVLTDGGFETSAAWAGNHSSVSVSAANANRWWAGEPLDEWIRKTGSTYPHSGQYCAGDPDGVSVPSSALVQFVPVNGTHTINLQFYYLLWLGEWGDTSMTYAVYGWNEGDTIDLSASGPGGDATVILAPKTLSTPQCPIYGIPSENYGLETAGGTFLPDQFDYVGVWVQYELFGGSFYLDDVQMQLLPEPATGLMLLAGAAGLRMISRRKR
jgi:hypothetical protein